MSRIRIVPRESPEHRQAREQRTHLDEVIRQLITCWPDHKDDPLAVEALRAVAYAPRRQRNHVKKLIGKPYPRKLHVLIERGMGNGLTRAPRP